MRALLYELYRRAARAYNLEDYHPAEHQPHVLGAPAYCQRCEQIATGWAWEQGEGVVLCLECYERSAYAHRPFRYK